MTSLNIGARTVGGESPVFIVAELSGNHRQDYNIAVNTLKAMKEAGADAVKLQTYTPDTITIDARNAHFQITHGTLWDGRTLHELYQEAYTPWPWHEALMQQACELGLICFSSPFDTTAVDFLGILGTPAYKIASLEITDTPLIAYAAAKGKPIILSTGIATLAEMYEAVMACRKAGNEQIALLKCVSVYPTPPEEMNLRTIPHLKDMFGTVVGLSDHTRGVAAAIASVALGAKIIEKHFILDKALGGPDCAFSLEPAEFRIMVDAVREVEKAIGKVSYELSPAVTASRIHARSLFVTEDMEAGELFTSHNVRSIRPANGLHPRHITDVLGRHARVLIKRGTPLEWSLID